MIGIDKNSSSNIIDVSPMGEVITKFANKIESVNTIISEHNAGNTNFWFDLSYPDWNAPEIVVLGK